MGAENSKVTLTDEEKAALTKYSAGDIAAHNTASDLWLIIHGLVVDVTAFAANHPGGSEILLEHAGKDATQAFEDVQHSDEANDEAGMFPLYN